MKILDAATTTGQRQALREILAQQYDAYVGRYGPINRFSWVRPKEITQERHDAKVAAAEAARLREPRHGTGGDAADEQWEDLPSSDRATAQAAPTDPPQTDPTTPTEAPR